MSSYFLPIFIISISSFFILTLSFSHFSSKIDIISAFPKPSRKLFSFFDKFTPPNIASLISGKDNSQESLRNQMSNDEFSNLPTWEKLGQLSAVKETEFERNEDLAQKAGRGWSNHKSNIRLFDAPDDFEPEITLYRDTAAWCPYCEKVWLQLEEKRIPYRVQKVPLRCYGEKPSSFMKINPSGGLPVAIIKGRTMAESNDIMMTIEKEFPTFNPLLPAKDSKEFQRVAPLMKLERRVFSVWFQWLTSPADASSDMTAVLRQLDSELAMSGGPYILGASLSFVDLLFVPFLERMAASLPYFKGFESRSPHFPALLKWYEAMDGRPAYQGIKSDYYSHCHDLPPQIGRCFTLPGAEQFASRIDGGDWLLSVPAERCFEPMLPSNPDLADRAAVRSLLSNHEAVVKFCSRAASLAKGKSGMTVSAPLADPYVREDSASLPAIDAALRHIVQEMLSPIDPSIAEKINWTTSMSPAPFKVSTAQKSGLVASLYYLRDRVGVPRDMSVHAARRLRAHINNFVDNHLTTD